MRIKSIFYLCALAGLAGCGTLKVDIVYDDTPPPSATDTYPAIADTPEAIFTRTPTPAITPSVTKAPAATASSPAGSKITALAAGYNFTCALTAEGGVLCWGLNDKGQLGDGTQTNRNTPVPVIGLSDGVAAIAAGGTHTCALLLVGRVKCWGENLSGQLGDGTQLDSLAPVDVAGLNGKLSAIAAGGGHTCGITEYGSVECWGWNDTGQLGDGKNIDNKFPAPVGGLDGSITSLAAGYKHTCALMENGSVWCWGWNGSGQLGNRTNLNSSTPVLVPELGSTAVSLTAGEGHTCALLKNQVVKCWGDDTFGQLGDGAVRESNFPVAVAGLDGNAFAVAAGSVHTCALTEGGVECWGRNIFGQLGTGAWTDSLRPMRVTGFALTATSIVAGSSHTCALTSAGGVRCWGRNSYGQLGDGTSVDRNSPVDVAGLNLLALRSVDPDREGQADA